MLYYIGQAIGIFATICCFVMPLFKKKWQMLACSAVANVFFALNLLLIGQLSSAIIINIVAVVQTLISLWHVQKGRPVTPAENIIFLILYVACGSLGFKELLDVLPIIGAVFNMLAAFQRDEQKTRILILLNASTFFSYYLIVGSTSMFAELLAIVTTLIAMFKYRKPKKA
ncbi:MAG: YgjV family protein [Clostridia bacterium]|nr:YgjV family protein [Clostridia bacterium]